MGNTQREYTNLLATAPAALSQSELEGFLFDVASGTNAFGGSDDWTLWFRFFLPELIQRSHEAYAFHTLAEVTVTAFFHFFRGELDAYDGFRDDVFAALGLCLMKPELWDADRRYLLPARTNRAGLQLDGALSALLVFGLHYLSADEVEPWIASASAIDDVNWQVQLIGWFAASLDFLQAPVPAPAMLEKVYPRIDWNESFLLEGLVREERRTSTPYDLLPAANRRECRRAFADSFTERKLLETFDLFAREAEPDIVAAVSAVIEQLVGTLARGSVP